MLLLRRHCLAPPLLRLCPTYVSASYSTSRIEDDLQLPLFSPYAFVRVLSSAAKSSSLSTGEQLHSSVVKLGFSTNLFINTALLTLYCNCRRFRVAQQLFDEMPERNGVTWNTLIYGHSQSHAPILAVEFFVKMASLGISLSPSSVSSVLVACSKLEAMENGMMLHCVGFKCGFGSNVVVGTALVDMYSKCHDVGAARRLFDEMAERNVITWTTLVSAYALEYRPNDAMLFVREMRQHGVGLNEVTYNSLLSSFSKFEDLFHGRQVHSLVIREGLEDDPYIVVTLITMYSKCGSSEDFSKLCSSFRSHDQVSCNSIISGFSHLGDGKQVLQRFLQMRRENIHVDLFTFASVLRAIAILSALEEGKQIHALIFKTGHASNVCVQNGLVSMYAKCGAIYHCKQVFSSMDEPDLVSWNSLLSGCAQHGFGREAVALFEQMRINKVRPDGTTFLSVLTACSHVGLVEKGLEYFYSMKEGAEIVAGVEHYACVVDLLGRAGYLMEAESFVNDMPIKPGVSVYRALLSACQIHGNVEIAKRAAEDLFQLCPDDPSTHVLLSNSFAADGSWDNAAGIRKIMRGKGLKKKPASSWVENRIAVA
ncbi:pentatricopeptide repeat-containing protein At1g11290, chloroplastic-like isoform X1 [Typha latifolia]|uniref:pentatricopeptide repeat-containing protein At1g11290, chloroplastic-like isoform X1 n=2 Tax=Typha latifolia TaxID=4733 RepID=UPI003C30E300